MDELVRWLGEQLNVDAERATAAAEELGADWYYDDGFVLARHEDDMVATGSQDFLERERGEHIATHDPARVLREIDAKRRTLERHTPHSSGTVDCSMHCEVAHPGVEVCNYDGRRWPCPDVLDQAAVYADRPGYREEWRP